MGDIYYCTNCKRGKDIGKLLGITVPALLWKGRVELDKVVMSMFRFSTSLYLPGVIRMHVILDLLP